MDKDTEIMLRTETGILHCPCNCRVFIVQYRRTRDMGGLPPSSTGAEPDYRKKEAAMSLYEILMVAIAIVRVIYDILSDLLRRRNKESE